MNLSPLARSSSVKGSVATLSGLVQLPLLGAEKAELPQEETEESEKEEHTDAERWNGGRLPSRLSLMSAHSCEGLVLGVNWSGRGAGVCGATSLCSEGSGSSSPSEGVIGAILGLLNSGAASDISMVGIGVFISASSGASSSGTMGARFFLFTRNGCAGGGGGSFADSGSSCCSGVFGNGVFAPWKSKGGRSIEREGLERDMAADYSHLALSRRDFTSRRPLPAGDCAICRSRRVNAMRSAPNATGRWRLSKGCLRIHMHGGVARSKVIQYEVWEVCAVKCRPEWVVVSWGGSRRLEVKRPG
jgi:hypothetical protein